MALWIAIAACDTRHHSPPPVKTPPPKHWIVAAGQGPVLHVRTDYFQTNFNLFIDGETTPDAKVRINGHDAPVDHDGKFGILVPFDTPGKHAILVEATNTHGTSVCQLEGYVMDVR